MELDWPLFTIRMNETWRKGRKLLDRSLRHGAMTLYLQMIQEKTREFLVRLRANPKDFRAHILMSVITCSLYRMTVDNPAAFREDLSCHSHMATT
jgi:cytochrome P450